jgi:hypothetical protein
MPNSFDAVQELDALPALTGTAECGAVMHGRSATELTSIEVLDAWGEACLGHRLRLSILSRQA